MTYTRPLLATDLSEDARPAASLLPLLSGVDARGRALLVLAHPDLPARAPPDLRQALLADLEARGVEAQAVLREWLRSDGITDYEAVVRYGSIVREIAREAETADVVAMGAVGRSRVERVLLGSIARGVLRRVACDALLARGPTGPLTRILLATDFEPSSRAAALVAQSVAEATGAHVHLLHVIDPGVAADIFRPTSQGAGSSFDVASVQKHAVEEIRRLNVERFDKRADERVVHGRPAAAIVSAAREAHADLVIVGSHGGGMASRILLGSVAEAVAERAHCSVLVVRPRQARGGGA